jgi:Tol biopolymer transport system component
MEGCSRHLSWSPDSREIIFDYEPVCKDVPEKLFRVNVPGGELTEVLLGTVIEYPRTPAWSPQGDWIAFNNDDPGNPDAQGVFVVRPDGTDLIHLASESGDPTWSPDGEWIAFAGQEGIHKVRLDGTADLQLPLPDESYDRCLDLSWSPDGTRWAYICRTTGQTHSTVALDLYVSEVDGSEVASLTELAHLGGLTPPSWSPSGDKIVLSGREGASHDVFLVDPDSLEWRNLTHSPDEEWYPIWSSDGQQISFLALGEDALSVMGNDGRDRRVVADIPCSPRDWRWSPNGTWIAFSCEYWRGGHTPSATWIYLVRVDPGAK